ALKLHDVGLRPEVLAELRVEQPRRADRQACRGLREMADEEGLRARERVVARLRRERPAFGYVYADRGLALPKGVGHVRRANAHAIELKAAQLIERAAEVKREPAARAQPPVAQKKPIALEVAAEV